MSVDILIVYYSRHGSVRALAQQIANGVTAAGATPHLRTVAEVYSANDEIKDRPLTSPIVSLEELKSCDGLAIGSPCHFGNMSAALKHFIDSTSAEWLKGTLIDKPASVFTSSSSQHGGNESTLLTMMLPLLHHGMTVVGTPYSVPELTESSTGGSPYGPTHVCGAEHETRLDGHERTLAFEQGKRLAQIATKLKV